MIKMYKRNHLKRKFICFCCLKTYSSEWKLKRHQQFHIGMIHFGFNYNIGIELNELFMLKNGSKHVYSRDKQFNCFLCCKQLRTSGEKTII